MKLLLVGPVGSGKGTQAAIISKNYGIPHISTGEIFRQHMQNKTELGLKAQEYINAGYLVPEEITFGIVKDRLSQPDCVNGFILDGYPRTMEQANNLETITDLDKVILIGKTTTSTPHTTNCYRRVNFNAQITPHHDYQRQLQDQHRHRHFMPPH